MLELLLCTLMCTGTLVHINVDVHSSSIFT